MGGSEIDDLEGEFLGEVGGEAETDVIENLGGLRLVVAGLTGQNGP